jgi:hypothetical protein
MEKITFTKTDILYSFWDESSGKWIERSLSTSELPFSWYLPYEVYIDSDVTLLDLFDKLEKYSNLINVIFINHLKAIPLETLISLLKQNLDTPSNHEIDNLCILWSGEVKSVKNIEEPLINQTPAIMGLQFDNTTDTLDEADDTLYSIRDMSVSQILELPIILDDILEFIDPDDDTDIILEGITSWTLYDVLGIICTELSTYCFVKGLLSKTYGIKTTPLAASEFFDYLETLDKFFNKQK